MLKLNLHQGSLWRESYVLDHTLQQPHVEQDPLSIGLYYTIFSSMGLVMRSSSIALHYPRIRHKFPSTATVLLQIKLLFCWSGIVSNSLGSSDCFLHSFISSVSFFEFNVLMSRTTPPTTTPIQIQAAATDMHCSNVIMSRRRQNPGAWSMGQACVYPRYILQYR